MAVWAGENITLSFSLLFFSSGLKSMVSSFFVIFVSTKECSLDVKQTKATCSILLMHPPPAP